MIASKLVPCPYRFTKCTIRNISKYPSIHLLPTMYSYNTIVFIGDSYILPNVP